MYDDVPTTSAEVVHPSTYSTEAYGNATVEDRNAAAWSRVTVDGGASHATVGQAGLTSMFAYTLNDEYDTERSVVNRSAFYNTENDRLNPRRPFTYDVRYAEGWYGDRLHAYRRGGETAYVWNVTFNDRENASEFRRGHEQILEYWDGPASNVQTTPSPVACGWPSQYSRTRSWPRRNSEALARSLNVTFQT